MTIDRTKPALGWREHPAKDPVTTPDGRTVHWYTKSFAEVLGTGNTHNCARGEAQPYVVEALERLAAEFEIPETLDSAPEHAMRDYAASGLGCSIAAWKVAQILRAIASGKRALP